MLRMEAESGKPAEIFCPECGEPNNRETTKCKSCGKSILHPPVPLHETPPASPDRSSKPIPWARIAIGAGALVVLAGGGYVFARYHQAQSDLAAARVALSKDNYHKAMALAQSAEQQWPLAEVKAIKAEAVALANSAHFYHLGNVALSGGHYTLAAKDFRKVAHSDAHYSVARHDLSRINTGTMDLHRVKVALRAIGAVMNDMQSFGDDYNTTIGYSNAALKDYQNNDTLFGFFPGTNFDTNVSNGETAFNTLESDESKLSTDVSALSAALGLVSATPTLNHASVAGIDNAAQGFVNDASQIDSNISGELSSFENLSNGTATQAYGVSSDVSGANQGEAAMTNDGNNIQGSVSQFVGYTSGVIGGYLGLTSSLKAEFKSLVAGSQ